VRRLFSNFARGWPGVGLLIMRSAAGTSLITHEFAMPRTGSFLYVVLPRCGSVVLGLFLAAGLWTPVVGVLVVILGLSHGFAGPQEPLASILIATLGAALALPGPGA